MSTESETNSNESYYQQWYRENRDRIREKRRKRWKNDPEYRRKNRANKRKHRRKRREERENQREEFEESLVKLLTEEGYSKEEIDLALSYLPRNWNAIPKVHVIGDESLLLFPIAYLSARIVKSVDRLRKWHEREVLPPATYRDSSNWRWYSWDYLEACARAAKAVRDADKWNRRGSLKLFRKELKRSFDAGLD